MDGWDTPRPSFHLHLHTPALSLPYFFDLLLVAYQLSFVSFRFVCFVLSVRIIVLHAPFGFLRVYWIVPSAWLAFVLGFLARHLSPIRLQQSCLETYFHFPWTSIILATTQLLLKWLLDILRQFPAGFLLLVVV